MKVQITVSDVPSISSQQIGMLVRQRRQVNRLTQRELSELAGVGPRLISELERGKNTLRMDAVNRALNVFGLMLGPVPLPRGTVTGGAASTDSEPRNTGEKA